MSKIQIMGYLVEAAEIKKFLIRVDEKNYIIVRKKLESERAKIVNYLKALKLEGEIKSVYRPKNKLIQKHLNHVVACKKGIDKSIAQIKEIFYK